LTGRQKWKLPLLNEPRRVRLDSCFHRAGRRRAAIAVGFLSFVEYDGYWHVSLHKRTIGLVSGVTFKQTRTRRSIFLLLKVILRSGVRC